MLMFCAIIIFNYEQINGSSSLIFGDPSSPYEFGLFAKSAGNGKVGTIYYRMRPTIASITNLHCLILTAFAIPRFEYTQVIVITYNKLPNRHFRDTSVVSNPINLYLSIISIAAQAAL